MRGSIVTEIYRVIYKTIYIFPCIALNICVVTLCKSLLIVLFGEGGIDQMI